MSASIYTHEELERIEWLRKPGPCLREEMIRNNKSIFWNAEDAMIKGK